MENWRNAPKFLAWRKNIEDNGLIIHDVASHYTRYRYNGDVLFSLLTLDATTPEGDKIPPVCFLKGEVVCMLICLIDPDTAEKFVVLVRQRRIAEGAHTWEHPAGMVDDVKTPLETAVIEIQEETGISIQPKDLIDLNEGKRYFPSTGTSDEAMYFYAVELRMTAQERARWDKRSTGTTYEHERIVTEVVPFLEAHRRITNTNGLLLNYMYLQAVEDWTLLKQLRLA